MTRKGTTKNRVHHGAHRSGAAKPEQAETTRQPKHVHAMGLVERSVLRSGLSYDSFVRLLIQSALSRLTIWTQADLDRLLMLSERLGLDPLNNEIFAIEAAQESGKKSRVLFVVGVDGWLKIINSHPQFDGMRFIESAPGDDELPLYMECTIFRKDRRVATSVREYMHEAHTNQGAWLTHPRRMLRHKAMVQCARACFGLGGLYEPDEAERVSSAMRVGSSKVPLSTAHGSKPASGCANITSSTSTASGSTDARSSLPHKPLGNKALKGWIEQAARQAKPRTGPDHAAPLEGP
jgi:phage recombination protein Bet